MAIEKYPTESILRMLATLEPTIEALLKSNTPMSPIVKEKIEQMEKIVSFIPLDEEAIAASWHSKLANWWVEFATQQIPYLVLDPSKEELEMITPPPSPLFGVRRRKDPVAMIQDAVNKSALISSSHNVSVSISSEKNFDLSSNLTTSASKKGYLSPPAMKDYCFAVPENPKALPPSSSNDQPASVFKSESNSFQQVGNNSENFSKVPDGDVLFSAPPNTDTRSAAVVLERESTFKQVSDSSAQAAAHTAAKEHLPSRSPKTPSALSETANARPVNGVSSPIAPKERYPLTVPLNYGSATTATAAESTVTHYGHQQAPSLPKPEPVFEPVPDDFDWAAPPKNPVRPNPFASSRTYLGEKNFPHTNRY